MKNNESIPMLFLDKRDCCGCSACYAICPKKAISMNIDDEGFEYPVICHNLCVKCYRCLAVCPIEK